MNPDRPSNLRGLAAGSLMMVYPLLVYLGFGRFDPRVLGLLLLGLALLRWQASGGQIDRKGIVKELPVITPLVALYVGVWASGNERLLLYLPAIASAAFGIAFAASLRPDAESWIERLARMSYGADVLPPTASTYCRRVTCIWALFLVVNAGISGTLATIGPLSWWALYSGLIAYALMGLLMAVEYIYRCKRVRPIADREAEALGIARPNATASTVDQLPG